MKIELCKYLVFAGANCYPMGGWGDFLLATNNHKKAKKAIREYQEKELFYGRPSSKTAVSDTWGEIVNLETGKSEYTRTLTVKRTTEQIAASVAEELETEVRRKMTLLSEADIIEMRIKRKAGIR